MLKFLKIFFICLGLVLLTSSPSYANNVNLGIYPAVFEIEAEPGAQIRERFTVFAEPGTELVFTAELFEPDGLYGHVRTFIPVETNSRVNPLSWIKFEPEEATVFQNSFQATFTIDVPRSAVLGEYQITVFAGTYSDDQREFAYENNAKILGKIGTNILLTVKDENYAPALHAELIEFTGRRIQFEPPFKLKGLVENKGADRIKTEGELKLYPFWGVFPERYVKADVVPVNVVAGAKRYLLTDISESELVVDEDLKNPKTLGAFIAKNTPNVYLAELTLNPSENTIEKGDFSFIYLPINFLILISIIVLIFVLKVFLNDKKKYGVVSKEKVV